MEKNIKLYILNLGRIEMDFNIIVNNATVATVSDKEAKHRWDWVPIDSILIDHPEGKILFDLGCHPDGDPLRGGKRFSKTVNEVCPFYYDDGQTMEEQLALCGTKPEEIKTIVFSHMHYDHTGYLYLFPHANVIVYKKELESAVSSVFEEPKREFHSYLYEDIIVPAAKYTYITEDTEIFDDIKMYNLKGHTQGLCGLMIKLKNTGPMFFVRDACNTSINYGPPTRLPGLVENVPDYFASTEKIRKIAAENNATVVFGHDKNQFMSMKHAPEYYD
ncbi:MAG: N-acyl homoserine lactonase family protein [Synergistaceae bacterium]|jgi:glyoxylase-like metal-dependent hydrolase (beta-lactamase superfamily II)|nr:N-acyl homoserine lactonase family protein [Synergistaceae bacterium]